MTIFSKIAGVVRFGMRLGVSFCQDAQQSKSIQLCNQISLCLAICSLAYFGSYTLLAHPDFSLLSLTYAIAFLGIPVINYFGAIHLSRLLFITFSSYAILTSAIAVGRASGIHLLLLPYGWISLALFDWKEKRSIFFGAFLTSALLIVFEIFGSDQGWNFTPSPEQARFLHFSVLFATLIGQIGVVVYIFQANNRTETYLASAGKAAKAADIAKSQFLANMSHEIRTPLNGILGLSSLLLKHPLPEKQRESVQAIQSSGLDLMAILSEILDLSKIEAGKMQLDSTIFDPREIMASVLRNFQIEAKRKNLNLGLDFPANLPARLLGDPFRFRQLLNNILDSTVKLFQTGKVTLKVWCLKRSEGEHPDSERLWLKFDIDPVGTGKLPPSMEMPSDASDIWDGSASPQFDGTGLGLFISRRIIELMGGSLVSRKDSGGETGFHFEIPFSLAPEQAAPAIPENNSPSETAVKNARGLRLLIVEDHLLNQKVLAGFLEQYQSHVDAVDSGQAAVDAYSKEPYRVVFMDCHMPGMDGFECTRQLRKLSEKGNRPIIIGVTADAMQGTREKCLQAGMDDVLTKPILGADLSRVLSHWFSEIKAMPTSHDRPEQVSDWVDVGHLQEMDEWIRTYDPDFWNRSLDQFRDSAQKLIASIHAAGLQGRFREMSESAHALKGLCLMMGLSRMGNTCKSLESLEPNRDWSSQLAILESDMEPSLVEMRKSIAAGNRS